MLIDYSKHCLGVCLIIFFAWLLNYCFFMIYGFIIHYITLFALTYYLLTIVLCFYFIESFLNNFDCLESAFGLIL